MTDTNTERKSRQTTCQTADQRDQRTLFAQCERFGEPLNRKRRIGFDPAITSSRVFSTAWIARAVSGTRKDPVNV